MIFSTGNGGTNTQLKRTPVLSVDVEDYFQTEAFKSAAPRSSWQAFAPRVEESTRRLLDLFDRHQAKATFFVLGWVADRLPHLVREIAGRGHELACHSYWHRCVYSLTAESFRNDTINAMQAIEDASGVKVRGYRAPTWSITSRSLWALDVLVELGFEYDSSVYPIHHDLYGIPGAPATPFLWQTGSGSLLEIPPATLTVGRFTLPAAGGGYLRIFPLGYSRLAIERMRRMGQTAVIYLHPWEIDREQPRLDGSWKSRFRQYWGLNSLEKKLDLLLGSYGFISFEMAYDELMNGAMGSPVQAIKEMHRTTREVEL